MAVKNLTGLVISQGKMSKTVKVRVLRTKFNRQVQKEIVHYRDFMVHDEDNRCREGDVVRIQHLSKLSKNKSFVVTEIMKAKGTEWKQYEMETPNEVRQEERALLEEYKTERENRLKAAERMDKVRQLEKDIFVNPKLLEVKDEQEKNALMQKYDLDSWPPLEPEAHHGNILLQEFEYLGKALTKSALQKYVLHLNNTNPHKLNDVLSAMGQHPESLKLHAKKDLLVETFYTEVDDAGKPLPKAVGLDFSHLKSVPSEEKSDTTA
uniref:ARAD1C03872p n=1 Tax=Blastobotrys adeninivorans TaxID=409370 RepID=A0A060SYV5_BLAAD